MPFAHRQGGVPAANSLQEVCHQAQMLLNKGLEVSEVGRRVGILANTLHKALRDGRLVHNKNLSNSSLSSTKIQGSTADKKQRLSKFALSSDLVDQPKVSTWKERAGVG